MSSPSPGPPTQDGDSPEEAGVGAPGWLGAAIGLALLAAGAAFLFFFRAPPPLVERGGPAPPFSLATLEGGARVSVADYRGRVVLVNFWATWCKPCEEEIPAMERLYRTLRPDGFEILAISVDESVEEVGRFRERLGISFPILLDPDQATARAYQTTGFPESVLVDADGQIVERYVGPRDWDHSLFTRRIRELMFEDRPGTAGG